MTTQEATREKKDVHDFWNKQACGEVYAGGDDVRAGLRAQAAKRYELEPYIRDFAKFEDARGKDVLEIGIGMGADHLELAKAGPKSLTGVDLTERAVELTTERLTLEGLTPNVRVADAENLPFPDGSFDVVYSYGVLHHSPNTARAIDEVHRVLRAGGVARVMIYHRHSIVGAMLWTRFALLRGRPWTSLAEVYSKYLESPGTKAFTCAEADAMCSKFSSCRTWSQLSFGDLLLGEVGQRHRGAVLTIAKRVWPRRFIKTALKGNGGALMIEATK
jgi:ubiquinone/menaquinone biosynthesis C-methylase UbiE